MIDIEELFAGINKVNSTVSASTHFVHFYKETGNVISVTNSPVEESEEVGCVSIPKTKALLYLTGQRLLSDLSIQFDTKLKTYVLVDSDNVERHPTGLFPILEGCNTDVDLTVTRDSKNKVWKIELGPSMRTSIIEHNIPLKRWINLYLTQPNNPNALIRTIDTQLEKLIKRGEVQLPFYQPALKEELGVAPFSIYTSQYFDTYQLVNL